MTRGEDRNKSRLKKFKVSSGYKLPFCDHGMKKLPQYFICLTEPCSNLLILPSVFHEYDSKVLERIDLLPCVMVIINQSVNSKCRYFGLPRVVQVVDQHCVKVTVLVRRGTVDLSAVNDVCNAMKVSLSHRSISILCCSCSCKVVLVFSVCSVHITGHKVAEMPSEANTLQHLNQLDWISMQMLIQLWWIGIMRKERLTISLLSSKTNECRIVSIQII